MHGLGPGNVYVQVGFEYLAEDSRLSSTAKNTIYGDVSLFEQENPPVAPAQTAVKVMNDRGQLRGGSQTAEGNLLCDAFCCVGSL